MRAKYHCVCGASIEIEEERTAAETELEEFKKQHKNCLSQLWKERKEYRRFQTILPKGGI